MANGARATKLHFAARDSDIDAAANAISEGADLECRDADGLTPLQYAGVHRSTEVAKLLLEHGAEVDAENRYGNTPLWVAVFYSEGEGGMIKLLRSYGADPLRKNAARKRQSDSHD